MKEVLVRYDTFPLYDTAPHVRTYLLGAANIGRLALSNMDTPFRLSERPATITAIRAEVIGLADLFEIRRSVFFSLEVEYHPLIIGPLPLLPLPLAAPLEIAPQRHVAVTLEFFSHETLDSLVAAKGIIRFELWGFQDR